MFGQKTRQTKTRIVFFPKIDVFSRFSFESQNTKTMELSSIRVWTPNKRRSRKNVFNDENRPGSQGHHFGPEHPSFPIFATRKSLFLSHICQDFQQHHHVKDFVALKSRFQWANHNEELSARHGNPMTLGFTTAASGATGRSGHTVVNESFAHISRHG